MPSTPRSDCYREHEGASCNDRRCEETVCAADPSCCDAQWHLACAADAAEICRGRGGPGTISVRLTAPTPNNMTMADYADFTSCFTGGCTEPFCSPPLYPTPCCLTEDFDADGDVDLGDYLNIHQTWTGP